MMAENMLDNGKIIKCKEKEYSNGKMGDAIKDNI